MESENIFTPQPKLTQEQLDLLGLGDLLNANFADKTDFNDWVEPRYTRSECPVTGDIIITRNLLEVSTDKSGKPDWNEVNKVVEQRTLDSTGHLIDKTRQSRK